MSSSTATTATAVVTTAAATATVNLTATSTASPTTTPNKMETALDVLTRALQGDAGARSFLDQTLRVYVLDATSTIPKLFGAWNFLHQAMNEVERMESALVLLEDESASSLLQAQSSLLATFACQVARRSQQHDITMVKTCIDNYNGNSGSNLIDENSKLREIVMGRIAAHAFDGHEKWIQVVAANAVSNQNISHLLLDWIIPSQQNLQAKSLATLILHIAQESLLDTRPAGTSEKLQQLSAPCLQHVLGKVLQNNKSSDKNATLPTAIQALQAWLQATDLSLAQAQHLCAKVQINLVEVLSDAMYSDDPKVVDAIADLLEFVVQQHPPRGNNNEDDGVDNDTAMTDDDNTRSDDFYITPARFQQTRFIMGVPDEASFKANVTPQQLYAIESKELGTMLEELASAIALQRFRFVAHAAQDAQQPPQASTKVCLNLARICVAICQGYEKIALSMRQQQQQSSPMIPSPGCLDLLTKCASHPSVEICAMALPVVTPLLATQVGLATQWLPTLQRRAIVPHEYTVGESVLPSLTSSSMEFQDFNHHFRDTVLADALIASYKGHADYYLASCTAAIEEFCTSKESTDERELQKQQQTSFHLEAALFCMAVVAKDALADLDATSTTDANSSGNKTKEFLERCTAALAQKPKSLSNPLTLQQACFFIRQYDTFFSANEPAGVLDVAAELSLFIFTQCASDFPSEPLSILVKTECGVMPFNEAARTLESLLCRNPSHFLSNKAIAALGAGWEATFTACNRSRDLLTDDDRIAICKGICNVLAALPESQRATSLMALAMPLLGCLEAMVQRAESAAENEELLKTILDRAASEIVVLTALCRAYSNAATTRASDTQSPLVDPALAILRRAWDHIALIASRWSFHDSVLRALEYFLVGCIPPACNDAASLSLLDELCAIAKAIVDSPHNKKCEQFFPPVFGFLNQYVTIHGDVISNTAQSIQSGRNAPPVDDRDKDMTKWVKFMIVHTLEAMDDRLGISWATAQQQGNGQPAFEIKTRPLAAAESSSLADVTNAGLPSLFSLFQLVADRCSVVFLQLRCSAHPKVCMDESDPANSPGSHPLDLLFLRRTLESAVSSLLDPQEDIALSAIHFLKSILSLCDSSSTDMAMEGQEDELDQQHNGQCLIVEEFHSRIQPKIVSTLMAGCVCGKIDRSALADGCRLLYGAIPTVVSAMDDFEALVMHGAGGVGSGLSEHFWLGDDALRTLMNVCSRVLSGGGGDGVAEQRLKFSRMLTDLWDLHQSDTPEALAGSDAVQEFIRKYQTE